MNCREQPFKRSPVSTANYIARRLLRHFDGDFRAAVESAQEELTERGATFFRVHLREVAQEVILEGWRVQPREQGDLPL